MSATPLTDAVSKSIAQLAGQWVKGEIYPEDFAVGATESLKDIRTLERENQALREALASYMSLCGNTGYSTSRESFQMLYQQGESALKKATK